MRRRDNAESKADDAWAWTVIESYFEQSGMVRQQIDSFDKFLEFTVPAVVEEQRLIEFQTESRDPADPRVRVCGRRREWSGAWVLITSMLMRPH